MPIEADEPLTPTNRLWLAAFVTWAVLGITLLTMCSGCVTRHITNVSDDVPTMSDPTVAKLVQIVDGKEVGYCTVWKVGQDRLATAGHCCDEGAKYITRGPHSVPGDMPIALYDNDVTDVCIMKGKLNGPPLALAERDPLVGERVWTAGWPKGHFLISDGYWSGRHYDDDGDERSISSTVVCGGASGSPILDSHSRAVGVLIELVYGSDNISRIAPLEWLRVAVELAK